MTEHKDQSEAARLAQAITEQLATEDGKKLVQDADRQVRNYASELLDRVRVDPNSLQEQITL